MRITFASLAVVALAAQNVAGDSWFSNPARTAYNKWHETELERWLSDHDIPYPTPADRKDLENLMKNNWEDNVVKPYNKWDTNQLSSYLSSKGQEVKKGSEKNKDSLLSQVQGYWYETGDQANEAYNSVQSWIFDTWTESQLKAFLDYHSIPNPTPRTRDSLLQTVRSNYQQAANKAGETINYPGDWIYSSWSDSDLKAWLDERGVPVPQPGNRDKLIASLRRNSRLSSDQARASYASASSSAASAQQSLSDQLLESWSDSQIKEWFDKNGIKVPQGSKRNELVALARKHSNQFASSYGAATSSAGNFYAQATSDAYANFRYYYDYALNQVGFASKEAQASLSSLSSSASVEASKSSSLASNSASSASKQASKSGASAASSASKSAESAKKEL